MATLDDFMAVAERVRNWGRWGTDDTLGTFNHITEARARDATRLVRRGKSFALGTDIRTPLWSGPYPRRDATYSMVVTDSGDLGRFLDQLEKWGGPGALPIAQMGRAGKLHGFFAEDYIHMPLQCSSQWDGLAHVNYGGKIYNGHSAACVTCMGAVELGMEHLARHVPAGRGVLLDVPRHRNVTHLPAGAAVTPEELEAVAKAQNVEIRPGDILLFRTGWWANRDVLGRHMPGLAWSCAQWLHERDIAAVAADNPGVEIIDAEAPPQVLDVMSPLHMLCLRDMGMIFGELWNFDELATDCARDRIYEFFLAAPPLYISGAVGSPVNPVAMK